MDMSNRQLHIAAYDVRNPRRLRRALYILKDFTSGGQKSVFECYLSASERKELLSRVGDVLDTDADRFMVVPIPAGALVHVMGVAVKPADPDFYMVV